VCYDDKDLIEFNLCSYRTQKFAGIQEIKIGMKNKEMKTTQVKQARP
jgi:hypothetical protein